jgi:hypothetical protein
VASQEGVIAKPSTPRGKAAYVFLATIVIDADDETSGWDARGPHAGITARCIFL